MYAGTYNRTCEAIELQHELFQIDEVAELLGQLSCNTQVNVSKHTIHVCWSIPLACETSAWNGAIVVIVSVLIYFVLYIAADVKTGQIGKLSELLGQFACKTSKMSANTQRMYAGTYNDQRTDAELT